MNAQQPIASNVLTVTSVQSGAIGPGQHITLKLMPRPQWYWRHPIRSWIAWLRWRRNPYRNGIDAVVVSRGGGSAYVLVHADGCCCLDCRNKVM